MKDLNLDDMKNIEGADARLSESSELDATLQLLNRVQPPARMEQRIHARLAQEQAGGLRTPLLASFAAASTGWTWPRAAVATATFTAGVVTATLLYPVLHTPRMAPAAASAPSAATAAPSSAASAPAAQPKLADVHPAFTVQAPGGRAAALNTMGTVAAVRSRRQHSDIQLAANRRDKKSAQAKLTKPAKPADASTTDSATQPQQ